MGVPVPGGDALAFLSGLSESLWMEQTEQTGIPEAVRRKMDGGWGVKRESWNK